MEAIVFFPAKTLLITVPLILIVLCLLLLPPLAAFTVSVCAFCFCRLIGKLFLQLQEFSMRNTTRTSSVSAELLSTPSSNLRLATSSPTSRTTALCINLNIDGAPIASRAHPHPSHSQFSRLLFTSLSLGIPFPRL
jgi:hypothetical protein